MTRGHQGPANNTRPHQVQHRRANSRARRDFPHVTFRKSPHMNKYIPALAMALGFTDLALLTPAQAATSNAAAAADAHVNSRSVATNYADSTALKVDGTT